MAINVAGKEVEKSWQQAGYKGLLDFDPNNGIVRYGDYEVFASDLGIKPKTQTITFDDYRRAQDPRAQFAFGVASRALNPLSPQEEAKMRAQFDTAVEKGWRPTKAPITSPGIFNGLGGGSRDMNSLGAISPTTLGFMNNAGSNDFGFTSIKKLGDDYVVNSYQIPMNVELLNTISDRAAGIKQITADTDVLRQNQQDQANRRRGAGSTMLAAPAASTALNK